MYRKQRIQKLTKASTYQVHLLVITSSEIYVDSAVMQVNSACYMSHKIRFTLFGVSACLRFFYHKTGKGQRQPANIMWFTVQLINDILDLSKVEILNYHFFLIHVLLLCSGA